MVAAKLDELIAEATVDCYNESEQRTGLYSLELPLPTPPPRGTEWIEAYRRWARGGG